MQPFIFKNSRNEDVVLNELELLRATSLETQIKNSLGMEINVTSLTTILKAVIDQKFFEVKPSDFMPVVVGEGAWSEFLTTYRSYQLGDDFEKGLTNSSGSDNGRNAMADAGVDAVNLQVFSWNKGISWTLIQLQQALKAGNWDLIAAKERARKTNYDLGIQKMAFLGLTSSAACQGLLNQSGITNNTALIPTPLYEMSPSDFKLFTQKLIAAFRVNCNKTAWPSKFVIPEPDFLGLVGIASTEFPLKSMLQVLEECMQVATRNKNFKIEPLVYGDMNYNNLGYNVYALYNENVDTMRLNIPVDYTNTLANSIDNFTFQNAAYAQFTGLQMYRPLELMYFTNTASYT